MILRHAVRQILLRPAHSLLIVAMLAVGLGATTAMFTNFHTILIQPIDVPDPQRLVNLSAPGPKPGQVRPGLAVGNSDAVVSYPMFRDLESSQTVFSGLAAHYDFLANLSVRDDVHAGHGVLVSGSYFDVLQLQPALGRLISPQDEPRVGESPVVVLSWQYWQNRFGGDPGVIGQQLRVNNQPLTIIGVAPEGFSGTMPSWVPSVFVPLTLRWLMQPEEPRNHDNPMAHWIYLFARLAPGVTIDQAEAELNRLYRAVLMDVEAPLLGGIGEAERERFVSRQLIVESGSRGQIYLSAEASNPLSLLLGSTVIVLLIICVNLANLMLASGAARGGEIALRASLGASRRRLIVQLLSESALLAALAGLLCLPVALATLRFMKATVPESVANLLAESLNVPALMFAAIATVSTLLVFALLPAIRATRASPARVIQGYATQTSASRSLTRSRSLLIGVQIALGMLLIVVAGLFTHSLANLARTDPGFDSDRLISFSVSGSLGGYSGERLDELYASITRELQAEPGVVRVSSAAIPLMSNLAIGAAVGVVGEQPWQGAEHAVQSNYMISPGFFDTLSIPLLSGRDFTSQDSAGPQSVAIVNRSLLRQVGLEDNAVGRMLRAEGPYLPDNALQIIGVVADARYSSIKGDVPPQLFTPRPDGDETFSSQFFYVRAAIEVEPLLARIPDIVARVDPTVPVRSLTTVDAEIRNVTAGDRLMMVLSSSFAVLAVLLAATGVHGVLAYNVAQRTREFGLRLALGAKPADLNRLVLRQVSGVAVIAAVMGLALALLLGRFVQAVLYGLSGHDPLVIVTSIVILGAAVFLAAWLPARRAARIAPMEALRDR